MEKASFGTQANALLRKNLAFQKRNKKTNCVVVVFPVVICALLVMIQNVIDAELNKPRYRCDCACVENGVDGTCRREECGLQSSPSLDQVGQCPVPSPPQWPPILQVPRPQFRAADGGANLGANGGLPNRQCRRDGSCPSTVLLTGGSRSFATGVASKFFDVLPDSTSANASAVLSTATLGSSTNTRTQNFLEPAFFSDRPLYRVQPECTSNSSSSVRVQISENLPDFSVDLECVRALSLWRNNASEINDELYKGYRQSNRAGRIDEIMAAYDFMDSGNAKFDGRIWYNSTYKNGTFLGEIAQVRVVSSVNVMSNSYIKNVKGGDFDMKLEFTKEMPKSGTKLEFDATSILGPLFFLWIIELVFPIILTYLVYEKQYKLRIMMKMHGLGDGPYWIISYLYFLLVSAFHVLMLVLFGSIIGLNFFTSQDYSLQFVFYFAFINLQIALAFLVAPLFNRVISAQAIAYVYLFGSGLLAGFLFQSFIQDLTFSESWIRVMELFPPFALYRGLYEFGEYASNGKHMDTDGMRWKDLNDDRNGMKEVLIIMMLEWLIFLPLSYYVDQFSTKGRRMWKNPLSSLPFFKKSITSFRRLRLSLRRQVSKVFIEIDKPDVAQERELVEQLRLENYADYAIVSDNLKKVYPGKDGNPDKLAVQGLSLALAPGECFGMLGPNGAGKTTFISMMIGLTTPSSGDAYVEGHSINTEMEKIYTSMGVCPQHDMLWETLTAREHLLFYGRLKNLKGSALTNAVEESLKSVSLFHGGIGDKQAMKYSGGMKRRLSVAISLIGDPKVVYMDEPSTGLDPASRNNLWKVVKKAKQNRAIILTTHSMEEAEVLCDRLGIFVGGALQCIGNPKQLKARYGDTYVFTITTRTEEEQEVENLICGLSSNATKIYHLSGTQKFEIPKQDVEIADVFQAVEKAKRRFHIQAWGLANTTLEDVFIKVAKEASSNYELS